MGTVGTEITWAVLRVHFLEKYFPEDVQSNKETEFLKINQGNMIFVEYVARFEELIKFHPHYNGAAAKGSKCIKFESGLHLEIKKGIEYKEIFQFPMLGNKCRIYDEDNMAHSAHYKSISER